ncbi:serine protease inhibitor 42Dd-like [Cochliomyia hominivorax]
MGQVNDDVRNLAFNNFASELEQIDFVNARKAASIINSWVGEKTHQLIRDIVSPATFSPNTNAVILNSLYFKSEWLNKFSIYDTKSGQFQINSGSQVPVEMMSTEDTFRYGDFNDLQASVLELPYITSDLSMMLILPQTVDGLAALEHKLLHYNLDMLSQQLRPETVAVQIPKFKIELDVDMMQILKRLGPKVLFNKDGKINIFKDQQYPITVDQIKHKTYISVNEDGTEAASASFGKLVPYSSSIITRHFIANHPFVFAIRGGNSILFIGHVLKI